MQPSTNLCITHGMYCAPVIIKLSMTTSSNGNICRVTGHLCGEFTGHRLIPPTKASDTELIFSHDDVIKWKHFTRYWTFVRGIHRSPANSPHKGQWHGALMFSLICVWIKGWENNREDGDWRRYLAHYDVIVMFDLHLNKRLSDKSWGWCFGRPLRPLWRHCDDNQNSLLL